MDKFFEQAERQLSISDAHIDANNILIQDNPSDQILRKLDLKSKPYKFQYELARLGINGLNNIICLRTGAGKTLISAIICRYWYLKYKKNNELDKFKVAFIVPTRHLAEQQYNAFESTFHENWSQTGKVVDEKSTTDRIAEYFKHHKILFMTAKKLVNTIEQQKIQAFDFTIIIFDECHHTSDLHPYSELMHLFYEEKSTRIQSKEPLIIGLTASLGVGKEGDSIKNIAKFCANLNCKLLSGLKNDALIQELDSKIPTTSTDVIESVVDPIEDKIICKKIYEKVNLIMKHVGFNDSERLVNLGEPEYEQFLVETKMNAEISSNRPMIIAISYLLELNSTFIRVQDFSMDDCVAQLRKFYNDSEGICYEPTEKFIRIHINELLNIMESSNAANFKNKKLTRLLEIISEKHETGFRGILLTTFQDYFLNELFQLFPTIQKFRSKKWIAEMNFSLKKIRENYLIHIIV
jgi:ERCC4-related helicase